MTCRLFMAFATVFIAGCGPHRITFEFPSKTGAEVYTTTQTHGHGIGPFLIGGGGYFFFVNEMSPTLFNYTGAVEATKVCPDGFARVSHHHDFGHSAGAAAISWLILVNAYHASSVEWDCLRSKSENDPLRPNNSREDQ